MPSFSRTFTNTEVLAMAGYQLNPGHSDLDNEQSMSVRVHDGLWDHVDLRCLLGDIRKAKADFYAGLRTSLAASVVLEKAKRLLIERDAILSYPDVDVWAKRVEVAVSDLRAAITQAEAA